MYYAKVKSLHDGRDGMKFRLSIKYYVYHTFIHARKSFDRS